MKKKPVISVILFAIAFLTIGAFVTYSFFSTDTVSTAENRKLAEEPSLTQSSWFDGSFGTQMESFLSDHVFHRSEIVSIAQLFESVLERKTDIKVVSQAVDVGVDTQASASASAAASSSASSSTDTIEAPAGGNTEDQYVILDDRIVTLYKNNDSARKYYWQVVNACFSSVPDYVSKYLMLVPSRAEFEEEAVRSMSDSQKEAIEHVYKNLKDTVVPVDVYSKISPVASKSINDIYFRTDHHWTAYGAYLGSTAFYEAAGKDFLPIDAYEKKQGTSYLGYLYAKNPTQSLKDHPDDLYYYLYGGSSRKEQVYTVDSDGKPSSTGQEELAVDPDRNGYYTFVESSFSEAVIDGRAEDSSCLVVVGDSYANVLVPWLADNYDTVIIIDPRYYDQGSEGFKKLIEDYKATDFMIVDFANVLSSTYFTSQIAKLAGVSG